MLNRGIGLRGSAVLILMATCGGCREKDRFPPLPEILPEVSAKLKPEWRKRLEGALAEAKAKPKDARATGHLAMVLHAFGLTKEARQAYSRTLAIQPNSPQPVYLLARLSSAEGKDDTALWEAALRLNPQSVAARVWLVESLIRTRQLDKAQTAAEELLRIASPEAQSYYLAGRVRQAQGDLLAATQFYATACDINPRFGVAQAALAEVLRSRQLMTESLAREDLARRYRGVSPPIADPIYEQLNALRGPAAVDFEAARRWRAAGNPREALLLYQSALKHEPAMTEARSALVALLLEQGQFAAVTREVEAAQRARAMTPDVQVAQGQALIGQKRLYEAEKVLQSITTPNAEASYRLSVVQEGLKKGKLAEASCRKAIELDPKHREAHVSLARMVVNRDAKEAVSHLEAALQPEDERTVLYLYLLSDAYFRMRNFDTALDRARRAKQLAGAMEQKQLQASAEAMIGRIMSAQSANTGVRFRTPNVP